MQNFTSMRSPQVESSTLGSFLMSVASHLVSSSLRKLGVYELVRYSTWYYWLLPLTHPQYHRQLKADERFYRGVFRKPIGLAFDVGANIGDKAWILSKVAGKVVCCEPDPVSFSRLQRRFRNRKNFALERSAIGAREGDATFHQFSPGSAYNSLNSEWSDPTGAPAEKTEIKVGLKTLDNLFAKYRVPDYIKIDVEGWEWEVIQGLSRNIPVLSFEANLPQFRSETRLILQRFLSRLPDTRFNVRRENNFVFASDKIGSEILRWLEGAERGSYELFVFAKGNVQPWLRLN